MTRPKAWHEGDEILAVKLRAGEVLVFKPARKITPKRKAAVEGQFRRVFPDNRTIVVQPGDSLEVVQPPAVRRRK